jgi:hypothetical protein
MLARLVRFGPSKRPVKTVGRASTVAERAKPSPVSGRVLRRGAIAGSRGEPFDYPRQ